MSARIRFLGVAGYEIWGSNGRVLVDPFLSGNELTPVTPGTIERPDVILVSHAAYDHLGDTAEIALRTHAPVVCGGDVRLHLLDAGVPDTQIRPTVWGIVVKVGGVVVRPVECHHWSMRLLSGNPVTGTPMAFIVEPAPGIRVYHYGDTAIFDMRLSGELYRPTVGIFGCTNPLELSTHDIGAGELLTGEMDPDEAALAAEMLGVEIAIASHYLRNTPDLDVFLEKVGERDTTGRRLGLAPRVGETVLVEQRAGALRCSVEGSSGRVGRPVFLNYCMAV